MSNNAFSVGPVKFGWNQFSEHLALCIHYFFPTLNA